MKRSGAALKKLARFALAGDGQANNKQQTTNNKQLTPANAGLPIQSLEILIKHPPPPPPLF